MKKVFAIILVTCIILSFIPIVSLAADKPLCEAVVSNPNPEDRLHLRKSTSKDAASLGKYYNGTNVHILKYVNKDWAKVSIGIDNDWIEGYMLLAFLDTSSNIGNVQMMGPVYQHKGSLTLYKHQSLKGDSETLMNPRVQIMGFTDKVWHVAIIAETGISWTGFMKAGNKQLVEQPEKPSQNAKTAVINNPDPKDRLHLREKASISAASLGKYYNGTVVKIISDAGNGWLKVSIGEGKGILSGYMQTQYLATGAVASKVKNVMPSYLSTSSSWDVFESPSLKGNYKTYGYLTTFQLMGFTDKVWHIHLSSGKTYFVKADNGFKPYQLAVVNNANPADRLNVRAGKGENFPTLGRFYNGMQVYLLEESTEGKDWVKVLLSNANWEFQVSGYMQLKYLAIGDATQKVKTAYPKITLNGKNGADVTVKCFVDKVTQDVIGTYPSGTKVTLLGVHDDYVFVMVDDRIGVVQPGEIKF